MKSARLAWWLSGLAVLAALVYLMATAAPARWTRPRSRGPRAMPPSSSTRHDRVPRRARGRADLRGGHRELPRRQQEPPPAGRPRRRLRVRRGRPDVVPRAGAARRGVLARPAPGGDHRLRRRRRAAARPQLVRAHRLLVAVDRPPPPPAPQAARALRCRGHASDWSRSASPASTARASRSCSSCRTSSSRTARARARGRRARPRGTAVVGVLTFWLHHKLPYKRCSCSPACSSASCSW